MPKRIHIKLSQAAPKLCRTFDSLGYSPADRKKFKADPSAVLSSDVDGKETEINTAIAIHLIRQGQFELADTFIRVIRFAFNQAYIPGITT